jgi:coatomer subunit zeta
MSLFSVNAILILSADDGSRIFANYYSAPHQAPGGMSSVASYGRPKG